MPKYNNVTLIVVIVIASGVFLITVGLVLATLAIPSMQAVIRRGNETSAIASLRDINIQEMTYNSTYPEHGFTCSLATLGGDPSSAPSANAAQLLPNVLASGHKSGYTFAISNCVKVKVKSQDMVTAYKLTAVPNQPGKTGNNGYCTDESGKIMFDPKGGTNCTQVLQ